jgi:hypothetical protein
MMGVKVSVPAPSVVSVNVLPVTLAGDAFPQGLALFRQADHNGLADECELRGSWNSSVSFGRWLQALFLSFGSCGSVSLQKRVPRSDSHLSRAPDIIANNETMIV